LKVYWLTLAVGAVASIAETNQEGIIARRITGMISTIGVLIFLQGFTNILVYIGVVPLPDVAGQRLVSVIAAMHILWFVTCIVGAIGAAFTYEEGLGGQDDRLRAASVMIAAGTAAQMLLMTGYVFRWSALGYRESRLFWTVAAATTLICPSVAWVVLSAWAEPRETFSPLSRSENATVMRAALVTAPELVALIVFFGSGLNLRLAETNPEKIRRMREDNFNFMQASSLAQAEEERREEEKERAREERNAVDVETASSDSSERSDDNSRRGST
jgi:hypothetical protein